MGLGSTFANLIFYVVARSSKCEIYVPSRRVAVAAGLLLCDETHFIKCEKKRERICCLSAKQRNWTVCVISLFQPAAAAAAGGSDAMYVIVPQFILVWVSVWQRDAWNWSLGSVLLVLNTHQHNTHDLLLFLGKGSSSTQQNPTDRLVWM